MVNGPSHEYSSSGDLCHKKKDIDMLVKVRESPVAAAAPKNSSDAQPAWKRVSIGIDSGACDNVRSPENVPDHEVHESDESPAR